MNAACFFREPVFIGDLRVKNRVFLAPLAGVSDIPFRRICQEAGAGLTYVEMLSSVAILQNSARTFHMMARHPSETVLGVQVTGSSARDVAAAVRILDAQGFETLDVNMGCPVRKVVSAGCGSAILKEPERISDTVAQCRQQTKRPLSVKCRLGYTRDQINIQDTALRVRDGLADMLTIHGRTRSESYATPCDTASIQQGIQAVRNTPAPDSMPETSSVVLVGNGDIFDYPSAIRMRQETGCDAVMVSRGALGNPWVFQEITQERQNAPTLTEWHDTVCRHVDYQKQHFGDTSLAAVLMRKHLLWYAKGFPGCKALRQQLNQVNSLSEALTILGSYVSTLPAHMIRFESEIAQPQDDPKFQMDRVLDRGVGDDGLVS